jgi:hypothetical protein
LLKGKVRIREASRGCPPSFDAMAFFSCDDGPTCDNDFINEFEQDDLNHFIQDLLMSFIIFMDRA